MKLIYKRNSQYNILTKFSQHLIMGLTSINNNSRCLHQRAISEKKNSFTMKENKLKVRFLRGAKTSGESWSGGSFRHYFQTRPVLGFIQLLSNGWATREAVSSRLSGRRAKLITHIQPVVGVTTLYLLHTDSSRFTRDKQPLPFIFASNTVQFGLLQNSRSMKPHPHDWHMTITCLLQTLRTSYK